MAWCPLGNCIRTFLGPQATKERRRSRNRNKQREREKDIEITALTGEAPVGNFAEAVGAIGGAAADVVGELPFSANKGGGETTAGGSYVPPDAAPSEGLSPTTMAVGAAALFGVGYLLLSD